MEDIPEINTIRDLINYDPKTGVLFGIHEEPITSKLLEMQIDGTRDTPALPQERLGRMAISQSNSLIVHFKLTD